MPGRSDTYSYVARGAARPVQPTARHPPGLAPVCSLLVFRTPEASFARLDHALSAATGPCCSRCTDLWPVLPPTARSRSQTGTSPDGGRPLTGHSPSSTRCDFDEACDGMALWPTTTSYCAYAVKSTVSCSLPWEIGSNDGPEGNGRGLHAPKARGIAPLLHRPVPPSPHKSHLARGVRQLPHSGVESRGCPRPSHIWPWRRGCSGKALSQWPHGAF